MKKRFAILSTILIIASLGLIFFNSSSSQELKNSNNALQKKYETLQKQQKTIKNEEDTLLKQKDEINSKIKK